MLGSHPASEAELLAALVPIAVLFGGLFWSSYGVPASITVSAGTIRVRIRGLNVVWAFARGVSFPASAVSGVRVETGPLRPRGWRMPGTAGFGLVEGTYVSGAQREFWAVARGRAAVVIDLAGQPFVRVVAQVEDPEGTVALVRRAMFESAPEAGPL